MAFYGGSKAAQVPFSSLFFTGVFHCFQQKQDLRMEWIQNTSVDPAFNLALEEVLLNEISAERPDLAVLWQNRPAVVVGRFQNTYGEINALSAERHGVDVVRRMTGGGAVYHDAGTLN